jgi:multidrug resistance efflux pump
MPQGIFRESSLEKLSSPEQLDRVIKVTSSRAWLIIVSLVILVLNLLVWGVLGEIPTQVNANGVMISSGGIYSIQNVVPGIVSDVQVEPDDYVGAGDVLVRFDLGDYLNQINDLTKNIGLMNNDALQKQIHQKEKEYLKNSIIRSPVEGRVIEVLAKKGDACQSGQVLIKISRMGPGIRDLEAVLYVTTEQGRNIIPGMSVAISPSTVKKEEYGQITGQVISVSQYTVSNNAMLNILGSTELVQKFADAGPLLEVHASLFVDEKTVSGYKWSSRFGPPLKIQNGTICQGSVILRNERPIILLMPFLKKVLPMLN